MKAFAKNVFINQERKSEVRRRSDTAVVLIVNVVAWQLGAFLSKLSLAVLFGKLKLLGFGGSMVVKLKFKGIDGRAPLGVEPAV